MLRKILWADLYKKKAITFILILFVLLSAFLITVSASMFITLTQALSDFFSKASTPHYVQMTEGPINHQAIMQWATQNKYVKKTQIVEMLLIDGASIYLGSQHISEENSVMTFDFTTQNDAFDFLLNLKGQHVHPHSGEIAVPIYFMQQNHLKIGDKVSLINETYHQDFTIVDFVRDSQMNPSIVHSKRFIVHPADFKDLKIHTKTKTYLVEFQLNTLSDLKQFINTYQASDLPKNGPELDCNLYKILNSVTDGIAIGIIILVSGLLTFVAILCLRFTLLTTMEEDYRQIGIMKAIGISQEMIKNLYLAKYIVITGLACGLGYLIALMLKQSFLTHILLYMGMGETNIKQYLIPFLAVSFVLLIIILSCRLVLRKFNTISAVDALRSGIMRSGPDPGKKLSNVRFC